MSKMSIQDRLRVLSVAFGRRQTGNTTLQMKGLTAYDRDFVFVVDGSHHAKDFEQMARNSNMKTCSLESLERNLSGSERPIQVDHALMADILRQAASEIRFLEMKADRLQDLLDSPKEIGVRIHRGQVVGFDLVATQPKDHA